MIPCLYASMEKKFDNNGIGKMADAHSCVVTEKRNGSFELEMVYPADGIHADQLEEGNIILAKPSDTGRSQPFRIYKIATPIDGKLTVKARHISYQLNFITVSPFATTSCTGALAGLGNHAASECPFEVWTDISSSASFRLSVPSSFRNCLGGIDGSVLDTFGGEYEWDRYTVKLHHHRGADHGVHIVYGKNLIDFKMERNIESVITGVHPYWQNSETGEVTELPEKVVLVEQRSVPYQKITVLDCTSGFQDKPTDEMMRSFAQDYLKNTSLTEPQVDIDIDFIQLWNTPDYEDVVEAEQVSLCDTVHVFISKLGIEVSSKVTETQYDCLLERYEGITLSNSTVSSRNSSLTTALSNIRNTANEAYNTALRVETSMGEQIGGISVSMVYDGTLLAGLFGLHYQNVTEVNGDTVRYASRFARGEYNLGNNRILGYDCVDGELVPNKDAWIVKEVFRRFIEGESYRQIAKGLEELGAQSLHSKKGFGVETLRYMVSNETYVGDKRLQKKAPLDYLTKKPNPNQKVESNYLWDDHEAIIDRETWDKAQEILEKRKELAKVGIHKTNREHHFLYGKVFCGECGAPFLRRTLKAAGGFKTQSTYKAWNCRNRQKGKGNERCGNRFIKEEELIDAILRELEWLNMDQERFEKEVSKVLVYPDHIEVEKN